MPTDLELIERDEAWRASAIEILTEEPDKIVALLRVPLADDASGDAAAEGLVFMLGHAAIARGAQMSLGRAVRVQTIDSHVSFYPSRRGTIAIAEAQPVHVDSRVAIWRARVYFADDAHSRTDADCAAEVTETRIGLAAEVEGDAPSRSRGGRAVVSEGSEPAEAAEAMPRRRGGVVRQRLDQIFKGAFKVISKKGYGNATIREIAAAAGMPIPTMYLYIKTKEDLLYLMTKEYLSKLINDFEESLSKSTSSTAVLEEAVVKYIEYCNSQRRLINLVYREGKWLTRQNRSRIFELDLSFVKIWQRIVEHGIASRDFQVQNPELAANYIYFLCTAWALRHWNLGRFGEAAVRESLLEFILRAVKAEPSRPAGGRARRA